MALFLGGNAYKKCKKISKSFNDKKRFGDAGVDNSQKATGDIINNNCDMNAIATLTSANFSVALNSAYRAFELQAEKNLQNVIEETRKIIRDKKLELSGYTKIDWINIYFESAKNAADAYMQAIWAKVLAKELDSPGTFGYKTLDVLKNMSKEDFLLFEKMCTVQLQGAVVRGEAYKKHGLQWVECLKLSELGLLSLDASERTYDIPVKSVHSIFLGDCVIAIKNTSEIMQKLKSEVFMLTYAARELKGIVDYSYESGFVEDVVEDLKKRSNDAIKFEIQKVVIVGAKAE